MQEGEGMGAEGETEGGERSPLYQRGALSKAGHEKRSGGGGTMVHRFKALYAKIPKKETAGMKTVGLSKCDMNRRENYQITTVVLGSTEGKGRTPKWVWSLMTSFGRKG